MSFRLVARPSILRFRGTEELHASEQFRAVEDDAAVRIPVSLRWSIQMVAAIAERVAKI